MAAPIRTIVDTFMNYLFPFCGHSCMQFEHGRHAEPDSVPRDSIIIYVCSPEYESVCMQMVANDSGLPRGTDKRIRSASTLNGRGGAGRKYRGMTDDDVTKRAAERVRGQGGSGGGCLSEG
jgi:hypothetical protein